MAGNQLDTFPHPVKIACSQIFYMFISFVDMEREYYSQRHGISKRNFEDLGILKQKFVIIYEDFERRCYFQKAFGAFDGLENISGTLGADVTNFFYLKFNTWNYWPLEDNIFKKYTEDNLFTMIEFLFDHCVKPLVIVQATSGYGNPWPFATEFETGDDGKKEYRQKMNEILKDYKFGYEISEKGEIMLLPEQGMENLFTKDIPTTDNTNIRERVQNAMNKFRKAKSSKQEQKDAVKELIDVLEYLRPEAIKYLDKKDESDLFNIANNFSIRHHNPAQKKNYDENIWYSWMFYFYLSTIHALTRIIEKHNKPTK
jgi:hypothetical protein